MSENFIAHQRLLMATVICIAFITPTRVHGSPLDALVKGDRTITQISFENYQLAKEDILAGHLNILLIPGTPDISEGFTLKLAMTKFPYNTEEDKRFFGYKYATQNAAAEIEAQSRAENGEPVTYEQMFPGTFFVSGAKREDSVLISSLESQNNISFLPLADISLEKNSRMAVIPDDVGATITVRRLYICGDGTTTDFEMCDDNNTKNGDGCNQLCAMETGYTCSGEPSACHLLCGDGRCDAQNEFFTCRADCTDSTYSIGIGGEDFPSFREAGALSPRPECQSRYPTAFGCVSSIVVRSYGYLAHIYTTSGPSPEYFGRFSGIRKFTTTGKDSIISTNGIDRVNGYTRYYPEGTQTYSLAVSTWDYSQGWYAPRITTLDELTIPFTIVPPASASRLQINPAVVVDAGTPQERIKISGSVVPEPQGTINPTIAYSKHPIYLTPGGTFSFYVWKNNASMSGSGPDDVNIPYDLSQDRCPVSLWLGGGDPSHADYRPGQLLAYKKACVP